MADQTSQNSAPSRTLGSSWTPPPIDISTVTTGDMPGDKIQIDQSHIDKAATAYPLVAAALEAEANDRLVVSVYGGSGVGKSEMASVLGEFCRSDGHGAYVMSGDNYPHRIPQQNDAERLSVYRCAALAAFATSEQFSDERMQVIAQMRADGEDIAHSNSAASPAWLAPYHQAGRAALDNYLGTTSETDFAMVNSVIEAFKSGANSLNLKRMGRSSDDIYFETVDATHTRVLIIEWTHGNNDLLNGVDIPIFLFSTPAETLAHRLARGRDKNADSPLINLVLELEQAKLLAQADRAALIIAKDGGVLTVDEFSERLAQ